MDKDHKAFSLEHWNENQPVNNIDSLLKKPVAEIKYLIDEINKDMEFMGTQLASGYVIEKLQGRVDGLEMALKIIEKIKVVNSGN